MSNTSLSTAPFHEAEQTFTGMRAVVAGADAELASAFVTRRMPNDLPIRVEVEASTESARLPAVFAGAQIAILAKGYLPGNIARQCTGLLHVIFLSEDARVASDIEALESLGITPHTLGAPAPANAESLADAAIEQCRRIVSPTGG